MPRTPQEIFAHHAAALGAGDLDEILADYTDDAVIISPEGPVSGRDGIREAFARILAALPDATWDIPTQIFEEDVLFITWSATSEKTRVRDAVDTFVFRDGLIRVQTVQYTVEPVTG